MDDRIKEFPPDGHPWRLDWLGKIRRNLHAPSEPLIAVHFTRITDDYEDSLSNEVLAGRQTTRWVGIGLLPILSIGSVWRNQRLASRPRSLDSISIDTHLGVRALLGNNAKKTGVFPDGIPAYAYQLGEKHFPILKDAPLLVFQKPGELNEIVIPQIEILRFYYMWSSKLARDVWYGTLDDAFNPDLSGPIAGSRVIRVHLRKRYDDPDAWLIARYIRSAEMRSQLANMWNNRRGETWDSGPGVHPEIGFPFRGRTDLLVSGKPMGTTRSRFLVVRIHHCSYPLPHDNVLVTRDNDSMQGSNRNDPNLEEAWNQIPPDTPVTKDDDSEYRSSEEPSRLLRKTVENIFTSQFNLEGKRLIHQNDKQFQEYRHALLFEPASRIFDRFSTAEGTRSPSETAPGEIHIVPPSGDRLSPNLEMFVEVLVELRRREPIQSILAINPSDNGTWIGNEAVFSYPDRIKGMRSWHLVSVDPRMPRHAVIAEVICSLPDVSASRTVYLLELERKPGIKRSESDEHGTLILCSAKVTRLDDETLNEFMIETAHKNGWLFRRDGTLKEGLFSKSVLHGAIKEQSKGQDVREFADRLLEKILEVAANPQEACRAFSIHPKR